MRAVNGSWCSRLWSAITFGWVSQLLRVGYRSQLSIDALWPLADDDSCEALYRKASSLLAEAQASGVPLPYWKLLLKISGRQLTLAFILALLYAATQVCWRVSALLCF